MPADHETVSISNAHASRTRVAIAREGQRVVVFVPDRFQEVPAESADAAYDWVRRHKGTVIFDFGTCTLINSPVIAWLFQVIQAGHRTCRFAWREANGKVHGQLRQYHLDDFVQAI